jgi:hypothetical protein
MKATEATKTTEATKATEAAKATYASALNKPEPLSKNEKDEDWNYVGSTLNKHLRSDTQRREIQNIFPLLEAIITQSRKTNKPKFEQWKISKFEALKRTLETTEPAALKVKDFHQKMKALAKNLGQEELFNIKKVPTPKKMPKPMPTQPATTQFSPLSLNDEFADNEYDFDDNENELEPDISDMPDLHIMTDNNPKEADLEEDDSSLPAMEPRPDSSSGSSTNLLEDQEDFIDDESEATAGATFIISNLEQTQNSIDNADEEDTTLGPMWKNGEILTQRDTDSKTYDQQDEAKKSEHQDETKSHDAEEKNPSFDEQFNMKETERLLDKEVQEIQDINLHTPNVHRQDSYEEYDFDTLAAQAIHNQLEKKGAEIETVWKKKRTNMEKNWNQKRQAIERQHRETMDEQANTQLNLVTNATTTARQEMAQIKEGLATANQTLQDIRNQNEILQKSNEQQTRQMGQLQSMTTEIKRLKKEMKEETDTLERLKTETQAATTKTQQVIQNAKTMQHNLHEEIESKVKATIQNIVDSRMRKVEKAIHATLQTKGRTITEHAKTEMKENMQAQTQELLETLDHKMDEVFQEATALLDQAVMTIGTEMDSAVHEFNSILADPQERTKIVERLQKRAMTEIRPRIQEIQEDLLKEVAKDIEEAVQTAQDDLHINQGKLMKETEDRIYIQNEIARTSSDALKADLRKEAEILEAALQDKYQELLNQEGQAPTTQPPTIPPSTPERQPVKNPYLQRAPPVSPHPEVNIPSPDSWHLLVSKCKEKVTLTYSLPNDATEMDASTAEAFYRQTEFNVSGYPAIQLAQFHKLTRRGNSIPVEYAMGWPPEYVFEGGAILYEKLTEAIPHSMVTVRNILTTHQSDRDGYKALMTIMKRSIPRLGQLPPKMEPAWPKGMTPTAYANSLLAFTKQQANFGRKFCDFEIAATFAQRGMEHAEFYNVASNRATQLVQMAANYDDFADVPMLEGDSPHIFATLLENYHQGSHHHHINMMANGEYMDPSINKFERNNNNNGRSGTRGAPRDQTRDRDGKPRELCPCCLRHGHNVEKGSVCWMGAQVENVLKYNKDNPDTAKKNIENFKTAMNPATIKAMQARFPEEFRGLEPDSLEMLEAAVGVFELFNRTDE